MQKCKTVKTQKCENGQNTNVSMIKTQNVKTVKTQKSENGQNAKI